jgi:hypothetical protein
MFSINQLMAQSSIGCVSMLFNWNTDFYDKRIGNQARRNLHEHANIEKCHSLLIRRGDYS